MRFKHKIINALGQHATCQCVSLNNEKQSKSNDQQSLVKDEIRPNDSHPSSCEKKEGCLKRQKLDHQSKNEALSLDFPCIPTNAMNYCTTTPMSLRDKHLVCNEFMKVLKEDIMEFRIIIAGSHLKEHDSKLKLLGKETKESLMELQNVPLDRRFCDGKVKTPSVTHS